jgi:nicotinamidase-related amidase
MLKLDPQTTALVLIDLQKGVVGRELTPYSGTRIVTTAGELAARFRQAGAPVVLVNVGWHEDLKDQLKQPVDQPNPFSYSESFSELVEGLAQPGDILITKRQWGAFHATELDLQLRRRGIQTIVLGGIATNMGVESTGRQAWELGYSLILAEDAASSLTGEMHSFSVSKIFPRIARVVKSVDIAFG